jgi:hypothetical protein
VDVIGALIGWKRIWNAQASVARAKQVLVDPSLTVDSKMRLRRLGIWNAQEPSRATKAEPNEGCIVKTCFWSDTTDLAETTAHSGYSLLLYYKRCIWRREGEERLQDKDRANYAHLREAKSPWWVMGHSTGEAQSRLFAALNWHRPWASAWARASGDCMPRPVPYRH